MVASKYISVKERIKAVFFKNENTGTYTITMIGKGGPIISSHNLDEAKKEFEKALNLSCSVKNLLFFDKSEAARKKPLVRVNKSPDVTYQELSAA